MLARALAPALLAVSFAAPALHAQGPAAPRPAAAPAAPTWTVDPVHSELTFRIRHLVSKVRGGFGQWTGTITGDPAAWGAGSVAVTIKTASIDTRQERRDAHLRSPDFFAADSFPEITFRSRSVQVQGSDIKVAGDLTIRGVTKPVVLEGRYLGVQGTPGKRRVGFEASTTINRLDYGVAWNRAAEGGGVVLGDDVEINIGIEAAEQGG